MFGDCAADKKTGGDTDDAKSFVWRNVEGQDSKSAHQRTGSGRAVFEIKLERQGEMKTG